MTDSNTLYSLSGLPPFPLFSEFRYLPKTPFHGGITTDTAPSACAWQASRMSGFGSVVST